MVISETDPKCASKVAHMGHAPHPLAAAIGQAVRNALTDAGLTQAQFAELSGLNIKTLGRRLSGTIPFTYPEIRAAADALGITTTQLIEDADRVYARRAA